MAQSLFTFAPRIHRCSLPGRGWGLCAGGLGLLWVALFSPRALSAQGHLPVQATVVKAESPWEGVGVVDSLINRIRRGDSVATKRWAPGLTAYRILLPTGRGPRSRSDPKSHDPLVLGKRRVAALLVINYLRN